MSLKPKTDHYDDAVKIVDGDAPTTGDDLAYAQVKATLALTDAVNALVKLLGIRT